MQLSLEPADAICRVPAMPSDCEVNEKFVTEGYFNPKIIIFAVKIIYLKSPKASAIYEKCLKNSFIEVEKFSFSII